MQREDCRNELIRETTNTKDNEKLSKKVEKSSRIFSKPVMHHSLVAKHSIQDEDLIVELSFPLSLNFYKIPINNRINFRKNFAKFKNYQQNEESVSFDMDVFISDNQSSDQNFKTLNSTIDTWKKKLSVEEFNQIRGFHNNMLNIGLMTQMANRNQSEILDVFTLNTHVLLSVKLNFKEAIILPCQYDCKEINDFIPKFKELAQKTEHLTHQNDPRPKLKLLKLTKHLIYCMCHNNQNQNHIWLIKDVEFVREEINRDQNVHLKGTIKASSFTEKFWFSETELIYDRICLRTRNKIENSSNLVEDDELLVVDKFFYTTFHGRLVKMFSPEPVMTGEIEVSIEIIESGKFDDWSKTDQKSIIFDVEIYSE